LGVMASLPVLDRITGFGSAQTAVGA
jgi:hypothetical protein